MTIIKPLLIFLLSLTLFAEQANQVIQGADNDLYEVDKDESLETDTLEFDTYIPEQEAKPYNLKDTINHKRQRHQDLLGKYDESSNILTYKNSELLSKFHNSGKHTFGFSFHLDSYDWEDSRGIFQEMFEESTGHMRPGILLFSFQRYLLKSNVNMSYGLNFGAGYSRGRGKFNNGQESDTMFSLWQLPLELSLGFEIPMSRFMKLAVEGGPAALGIIQNRNDRDSGDKGKVIRQIGYGFFAKAKIGFSLSNFISKYGQGLHSRYDISNSFLNFEAKMISIDNFKEEEISVSGMSIGLGLSFEYL